MKNLIDNTSPKKTARLAGFLYLIVAVCGMFAELYVNSKLIVSGDAAATASNIMANELLFRIGFVSNLISSACFLLFALVLYKLFKPVNKNFVLLFVFLVSTSVVILCINMLNQFAALLLLNGAGYLTAVFNTSQLQALSMFFLDLYKYGYLIAQIFFGGYLLPLGYLVFKSGFLPRIIGVLLIIAGFANLIDFFTQFLFPSFAAIISPYVLLLTLGEIVFGLWLLIKGVKVKLDQEK